MTASVSRSSRRPTTGKSSLCVSVFVSHVVFIFLVAYLYVLTFVFLFIFITFCIFGCIELLCACFLNI